MAGNLSLVGEDTEDRVGRFVLECAVEGLRFRGEGSDVTAALDALRSRLEAADLLIQVAGAEPDVVVSPMSRQMGQGRRGYRVQIGRPADRDAMVDVLEPAKHGVTLAEQSDAANRWYRSLADRSDHGRVQSPIALQDEMAGRTLAATKVPNELHLAVDGAGQPVTVPFDRGRSSVFAYSVADDRPPARGTATQPVSREALVEDERSGRFAVQVDAAADHGDGLSVLHRPARRPGVLSIPPEHVRALPLSAAQGIWAEIVVRSSGPDSAWTLFTTGADARRLSLVLDPDPDAWCIRVVAALGPRPHPEVFVVNRPDALPRAWRRAARHLLPEPPPPRPPTA
ncbi:hypothetical protein [Curtobacterium sp. 'Ferrero']|uniref:hypothetical protein n=1 Tax=Curtobacterium sp. 'Ferrero' TaxID=2033654 RepID=UPI001141D5B1|nr:hypothetical protein [Curtobacterium sp. 'Ferrero']